ncbi:MAG: UDP-2,3-diacylglucosamine diphosphatase [Rubrivivax sp.]|nr:UDP-2,3-diacylglucosamine diphosphatase [Rubrivivax sp.]
MAAAAGPAAAGPAATGPAHGTAWAVAWARHGGGTLPLPAPSALVAPPHWRAVDFISDLHLSEALPLTFGAFAAHLRHTDADAVFVLGDLFELWVGDDERHQPFAARCVQALAAASAHRTLALMGGNRDFLIGSQLCAACGAHLLPDPTLLEAFGQRVLLTHGDALCIDDTAYQAFRRTVRDPVWLAAFLARPLAERLGFARGLRQASDSRRQFDGDSSADAAQPLAGALLHATAARTLVHGHTHRAGSDTWANGAVRHVLGDWDLDAPGPRTRAGVLRLDSRGFRRMPPASSTLP